MKRYSSRPFPSYAYLPGKTPHPVKDPKGHSYGQPEYPILKTQPENWEKTEAYLYGVDLFNAEYFWEAHEAWESLWKALDSNSIHAKFLQGLIQTAAACLKYRMKERKGVQVLLEKSKSKLKEVQSQESPIYMGIDIDNFLKGLQQALAPAANAECHDLPPLHPPQIKLQLDK